MKILKLLSIGEKKIVDPTLSSFAFVEPSILETDLDSGQVYELIIPDPPATLEYDYFLHNCLRRAKKFL